jgi:shikimate dehydrogenase
MNVSGKTKVCAVIGDPIEHSLSPAIQNAAFQHLGLDYAYVAFTVRKEDLKNAILGVRGLGLYGLNVTMPHKIAVIQYLDQLDETARNFGSVNTILNKNGRLVGYTTDGIGLLNALNYNGVDPYGKKIAILGAGGASRSVSFALAREAKELVILNRTLEKAENLVNDLAVVSGKKAKLEAKRLCDEEIEKELKNTDILINTSSVGMHPNETETPVSPDFLDARMVVFDLVYEPLETTLLREARKIGAKTIDGLTMLVHQGAASFEIWTDKKAPIEVMMKVATEKLKNKKAQA